MLLYYKALDSTDTARDGSFKAELPAQYQKAHIVPQWVSLDSDLTSVRILFHVTWCVMLRGNLYFLGPYFFWLLYPFSSSILVHTSNQFWTVIQAVLKFQVEKCDIVILQRAELEFMKFLGFYTGSRVTLPPGTLKYPFVDQGEEQSPVCYKKRQTLRNWVLSSAVEWGFQTWFIVYKS